MEELTSRVTLARNYEKISQTLKHVFSFRAERKGKN